MASSAEFRSSNVTWALQTTLPINILRFLAYTSAESLLWSFIRRKMSLVFGMERHVSLAYRTSVYRRFTFSLSTIAGLARYSSISLWEVNGGRSTNTWPIQQLWTRRR